MKNIAIQLICPDQKGIIAQLTSILYKSDNNILSIEQHVDKESKKFENIPKILEFRNTNIHKVKTTYNLVTK